MKNLISRLYYTTICQETEKPASPSSSCSSPALVWGASHRIQPFTKFCNQSPCHGQQFFMNSSLGAFHGVQFFKSRLLQCGPPTGSQFLLENLGFSPWASVPDRSLLLHGISIVCSFLHSISVSFRAYSPWAAVWMSAPAWSSMGFRRTTCITMVFMGCKGISAPVPGAPSLPLSWLEL